jgi:hypothetical protein
MCDRRSRMIVSLAASTWSRGKARVAVGWLTPESPQREHRSYLEASIKRASGHFRSPPFSVP